MYRNIRQLYKVETEGKAINISPKELNEKIRRFRPTQFTVKINSENMNSINAAGDIKLTVNTSIEENDLNFSLAGNTDVILNESIQVNSFNISMAGKNKLTGNLLQAANCNISTAGTAKLELSGKCENVSFSSAGSVNVEAFDLETKTMELESAGRCIMNIHVKETLRGELVGSYKIRYKGDPVHRYQDTIGVGSIKPAGE